MLHLLPAGADRTTRQPDSTFKPDAYDPAAHPDVFHGVLARRLIAFVIDIVIIMLPVAFAAVFIFFLGLVTFFLGWALFWLLGPGTAIWALVYCGSTRHLTRGLRRAILPTVRRWTTECCMCDPAGERISPHANNALE